MADEVNVFMDPFLQIYTKPDQIVLADNLTESFHKDIVLREQRKGERRDTELLNRPETVEPEIGETMETEPEKPPKTSSSLGLIESKLHNLKVRERLRDGNTEKHREKEVANVTTEMTEESEKDKAEDTVVPYVDMMQNETFVEEGSKQNEGGDSGEITSEQQHIMEDNEEEQREQETTVHMSNKETKGIVKEENGKSTDIHEPKHHEYETDHLQDHDILTEKTSKTNLSEPVIKVDTEDQNQEFITKDKQELLIGAVCQDAYKPQDDTDHKAQSKSKESLCLTSERSEKSQSKEVKPNNEDNEHLYEIPDTELLGPAEYVNEIECVKKQLKQLDNITLNIAVTGSTGAGKSTFINAIRGLQPDDAKAAPTGATETTMTATEYPHPTMPNVKFWDLPGTGSPKFKAKKYLKDVKLDNFDFFILISSERFKENDITLARAIKEKKKLFYFLRSKIDNDIRAESQRKDFDEQRVLSQIREDCHGNLKDMDNPSVFLICSFELHRYDFQTLVDTLNKELPVHKRDALILSLPIYSSKILEEKIEMFRKKTWSAAVASGSIAVAPVPGLSMAVDAAILLGFFNKCYYAFGLDDQSIEKLSVRVNNPSLKDVRKSPLVVAIRQKKLSNKELSALANKEAAVKFAWSMVPIVGSRKTAEMSYSATLNLLRAGLQDLADTAREVLKVAGLTGVY